MKNHGRTKGSHAGTSSPRQKTRTTPKGPQTPPLDRTPSTIQGVIDAVHKRIRGICDCKLETYIEANKASIRPEHFLTPYFEMSRIDSKDSKGLELAQDNWLFCFTGIVAEASVNRLEQGHILENMISSMFKESEANKRKYQDLLDTSVSVLSSLQAEVRNLNSRMRELLTKMESEVRKPGHLPSLPTSALPSRKQSLTGSHTTDRRNYRYKSTAFSLTYAEDISLEVPNDAEYLEEIVEFLKVSCPILKRNKLKLTRGSLIGIICEVRLLKGDDRRIEEALRMASS